MKTEMGDLPLVVLCGGRGTRLRPATDDIPKALVPVNGQPIIDYIVKFFALRGVRDWYICLGYRGEQVRTHLESQRDAINAHYYREPFNLQYHVPTITSCFHYPAQSLQGDAAKILIQDSKL